MEMTINKLPAPTWNRLGMNESRISNITIDAAWKAQIQVSNAAITRENTEIDWNSLNSGLGQDMDILGESIEADSFHVEKMHMRMSRLSIGFNIRILITITTKYRFMQRKTVNLLIFL